MVIAGLGIRADANLIDPLIGEIDQADCGMCGCATWTSGRPRRRPNAIRRFAFVPELTLAREVHHMFIHGAGSAEDPPGRQVPGRHRRNRFGDYVEPLT